MKQRKLILASGSSRRKELLEQIGLEFVVLSSQCEEVITSTSPEQVVQELALQKAQDVAAGQTEGIVLGSDTVVAYDGKILGKPATKEEAIEMLTMLQGNTHQVYTGVALVDCEKKENAPKVFYEKTSVMVYPMTEAEIQSYVDSGDPMDKAGSYGIQGAFGAYIKGIQGDYYNVVGLPIGRVYQELKQMRCFMDGSEN